MTRPDPENARGLVRYDALIYGHFEIGFANDASFLKAARAVLEADDLEVAGTAGTGAARQLAVSGHAAAMIMISTHAEADYADLLAESPVIGFLSKAQLSGPAARQILGRVQGSW